MADLNRPRIKNENEVWDTGTLEWVAMTQPGGGSGGAVTVADGADVTQGTKADAAWVSGSGSVISLLKTIASSAGGTSPDVVATGSLIGSSGSVSIALDGHSAVGIELTGNLSVPTLSFESTVDGSTWSLHNVEDLQSPSTGLTTSLNTYPGNYRAAVSGHSGFRVRIGGSGGGTASVTLRASSAAVEFNSPTVSLANVNSLLLSPLPLPDGASTEAKQNTGNASLASINSQLDIPLSSLLKPADTLTKVTTVDTITNVVKVNDNGGSLTVDGTVTAISGTATNLKVQAENYQGGTAVGSGNPLQVTLANTGANATAVKVDGSAVTQPISAVALPLPSGAATSALQPALSTTTTGTLTNPGDFLQLSTIGMATMVGHAVTNDTTNTYSLLGTINGTDYNGAIAPILEPNGNRYSINENATNLIQASKFAAIGVVPQFTVNVAGYVAVRLYRNSGVGLVGWALAVSPTPTHNVVTATLVGGASGIAAAVNSDGTLKVDTTSFNSPTNIVQLGGVTVSTGNGASGTGTLRVALGDTTVKAASTAAVASDTALVVAVSPNNTVPVSVASVPLPSNASKETGGNLDTITGILRQTPELIVLRELLTEIKLLNLNLSVALNSNVDLELFRNDPAFQSQFLN